jgi:integrase
MTRKRRGRGEGGVYQRADGQWVGNVSLGYGADGKRLRKVVYGATKKEAQDELRKLQNDAANGIDVTVKKITLGAWLTRWLALVKPTIEPNTYGPYERHVRLHLTPHLGGVLLGKLGAVHIQGLYSTLAAAGVSPALQRKIGTTLTVALNEAVRLDLIPGNAAEKVRKPKAAKPEIQVFDPEQVGAFLKAARSDRLYPYYLTALDSGARPGELFALLWEDVDFEGGFVSITKSLEEISGVLRVKSTKTAKSRRRIDLSPDTLAVLAEQRKAALVAGRIGSPVFHDTEGGYLRLSNLLKNSFKPILARAGLPSVGLYTLRHTCATLLLLADQPAKVVSERLGHSSVTLTLDTYSHVLPTMQKRAADVLGAILGEAQSRKAEA